MTENFGEAAARMSAAAAMLLGWHPAQFWETTPAELAAVLQPLSPQAEGPDAAALEALRRQFPDG